MDFANRWMRVFAIGFAVLVGALAVNLFFLPNLHGLQTGLCLLAFLLFFALFAGLLALGEGLAPKPKIASLLRQKPWLVLGLAFLLLFAAQLAIVRNTFTAIGWDPGCVVTAAAWDPDKYIYYFGCYPNNLFLMFLFRGLYWVFTTLLPVREFWFALDVLNLLIIDLALVFLLLSVWLTKGKRLTYVTALLALPLVGITPWVIVPYSDTFSLPFVTGLYLLYVLFRRTGSRKGKALCLAGGGILLGVGFLIKPHVLVVGIAIVIMHLLRHTKSLKSFCINALCCALPFVCVPLFQQGLMLFAQNGQNYIPVSARHAFPVAHFLQMGSKPPYGTFDIEEVGFTEQFGTTKEMSRQNMARYSQRMRQTGPVGYVAFLAKKAAWVTSDGTFHWFMEGEFADLEYRPVNSNAFTAFFFKGGQYFTLYKYAAQGLWMLTFLLVFVAALANTKKQPDFATTLLSCALFGVLCFILLFEGRSRYLLCYLPFFAALAAEGALRLEAALRSAPQLRRRG